MWFIGRPLSLTIRSPPGDVGGDAGTGRRAPWQSPDVAIQRFDLLKVHASHEMLLRDDSLLRSVLILPETLTLADIVEQFKIHREDFALVINGVTPTRGWWTA